MKPTKFESSDDATAFMGVSKQTLTYAHKDKRLSLDRKAELESERKVKVFFVEWLEAT